MPRGQASPVSARQAAIKLAVLLGIVGLVAVTTWLGGFQVLQDRDRVEELLTDSGPWGPVAFVLAFVALQPLSLPGALLIIPATFVWPWWQVTIYSVIGGLVASLAGFVLARWLARDWIEQRLPDRLLPWRQRVVEHELLAVIGLRVVTGYAPPADWLLGLSPVRLRAFVLGTVLGLVPGTAVMAIWGDDAVRWVGGAPLLAGVVALLAGSIIYTLYRLRNRSLGR